MLKEEEDLDVLRWHSTQKCELLRLLKDLDGEGSAAVRNRSLGKGSTRNIS